jgi:hypothetical protein
MNRRTPIFLSGNGSIGGRSPTANFLAHGRVPLPQHHDCSDDLRAVAAILSGHEQHFARRRRWACQLPPGTYRELTEPGSGLSRRQGDVIDESEVALENISEIAAYTAAAPHRYSEPCRARSNTLGSVVFSSTEGVESTSGHPARGGRRCRRPPWAAIACGRIRCIPAGVPAAPIARRREPAPHHRTSIA